MKDLKIVIAFGILITGIFSSCQEEAPSINHTPSLSVFDTTYVKTPVDSALPKQVLIEDISGAACPNCPLAATIAKSIEDANPGRINVVTLYPNYPGLTTLVAPININGNISKYDFRTDAAATIISNVSAPSSLPNGYIDRRRFSGSVWYEPKENWNADVASELTTTSPVNIDIVPTYTSSTNQLNVKVTLDYTKADSGSNYINIMILQDSILDLQESKDANGNFFYDTAYVHNHTLLDMLTAPMGDLLNTNSGRAIVPGRVFKISYQKTLGQRSSSPSSYPQPQWDPKHLSILVFVTEGSTTKYVLQSKIVAVPQ